MRRGLLRGKVAAVAAAALVGVLGAAAAFSGGPPAVHAAPADLTNSANDCGNASSAAVAVGNSFECDYFATQTILAGQTVKFHLTSGTTHFAQSGTVIDAPTGCSAVSGSLDLTHINIKCSTQAADAVFAFKLNGVSAGPVTMDVTYPNNTVDHASFNYQFDQGGVLEGNALVNSTSNVDHPGQVTLTCTNDSNGKQANAPIAVGDFVVCQVTFENPLAPGHVVVENNGPGTLDGIEITEGGLPNGMQGNRCGNANGTCTGFNFAGTAGHTGELDFKFTYYAFGAGAAGFTKSKAPAGDLAVLGVSTTTVSSSKSPSTVNQPLTFTATVNGDANCFPLGSDTVTFTYGGTPIAGPVSITSTGPHTIVATVSYTPTTPTAGTTLQANYAGDATCGSSSASLTQVVNQANTTTTLQVLDANSNLITTAPAGSTVYLKAQVVPDPGCTLSTSDTVIFQLNGNQIVAGLTKTDEHLAGGSLYVTDSYMIPAQAGTLSLTAQYEGNTDCASSMSAAQNLNDQSSKPSLSLTTTPPAPNYVAKPITLTATLGSLNSCSLDTGVNGDTIQFFANGNLISSMPVTNANILQYQTTYTPTAAGPYTFTVNYVPGANNFDCQGNTASTNVTVTQAGTSTKILQTVGNPTVSPGTPVEYEAIVSAQTGCVLTFNNQPNPDSVTFTVTDSHNNVVLQKIVTLTDNGSGSAGDAFLDWTPQNAGVYSVNVAYDNSANCGTSTASNGPLTLTVGATTTSLVLSSSANPVKVNHTVTFTAVITPNFPGCTFQGLTDPAPVFTYNGVQLNPVGGPNKPTVVVSGPVISTAGNGSETWTLSYNPPSALGQPYTVTANWAGNATCGGSSGTLQQGVTIGTATVAVNSTPNASTGNQQLTITATVTPDLANSGCVLNDSGTDKVQFVYNGTNIGGPVALTPGTPSDANAETAQITYTPTGSTGPSGVTISANYLGDASCAPASGTTKQVVNLAADTVILTGPTPANPTVNNKVTFTAEVDAGQYCVLNSTDKIDLVVNGQTVYTTTLASGTFGPNSAANIPLSYTPTQPGTNIPVHAHYEGNSLCSANDSSATTMTVTVNAAAPTVNVSSSANPSKGNAPITFTATVNPLNGCVPVNGDTVQFTYNGSNLGTPVNLTLQGGVWTAVSASETPTQPTPAGGVVVTAIYQPSAGNTTCTTATGTLSPNQVVNAGPTNTTIALSTAPNNPVANQPFTVTATVSPAAAGNGCVPSTADQVTFTVDGGAGQTFNLNGSNQATLSVAGLSQGQHTITATYTPAASNPFCLGSSTGAANNVTVGAAPAGAPTVALTSPSSAVDSGTNVQLIATVSAANGCTPSNSDHVTFSYNSTTQTPFTTAPIALVGGTASYTTTGPNDIFATGSTPVTINYISSSPATCSNTSGTGTVTVNSMAGHAATNNNFNYVVGTPLTNQLLGTISDPSCVPSGANETTYTVTIDWGDGTALDTTSGKLAAGCGTANVTGTHTYTASKVYTVKVTVQGSDLFNQAGTTTITDTATPVSNNQSSSGSGPGSPPPTGPYNGPTYQPYTP